MKKYFSIAATLFKAQFVYRFDVMLTALGTLWRVVFAVILWGAIFETRETVGGMTLPMMLSYYVITSFLTTSNLAGEVGFEVFGRILNGTFTKFIVIPANPQLHFLSQTYGAGAYYALFALAAAVVSTFVFGIDLVFSADPAKLLIALCLYLLGIAFTSSWQFFIGLWAFKFTEVGFILHVVPNVIKFIMGEMVPISLFPAGILAAFNFSPFAHAVYTPAMLLMDGASAGEGLRGLLTLALWTAAMFILNELTYKHLRTKYEGVGI
jgi:ABC-2 type transport system permease protein